MIGVPADGVTMDDRPLLEELASRLWDERQVVTYLLFKLTVTKLLLAADERRFVGDALREVDRTVELLRDGEARRDEAVRDLAEHWRVAPETLTLVEVARRAAAPLDHTFREHHDAFRSLAAEIEQVSRDNRALARTQVDEVTTAIDLLTGRESAPTTYDASGQLDSAAAPAAGPRLREVL